MTTTDPKLIEPVAATRAWANKLANMRQGKSTTPRCEPPGEYEIDWSLDRIREVLAASEPLYTAAAINEAVQNERAGIWARMCAIEPDEELAGCHANWGDFLQILEGELAIEAHKESQP